MPRQNHDDHCGDDVLYERNPMSPTLRAISSLDKKPMDGIEELNFTRTSQQELRKLAMKQYGLKDY